MQQAARALDGFSKPLALWRTLAGEWRRAIAGFTVYALVLTALAWPSVVSMTHQWVSSSSFHHAPLAAPLALWLILRRRDEAVRPRLFRPALVAIAFLGSLWIVGRTLGADIIEHIAFVSLLIAGAALFFGIANTRVWAFALAFLFFLVPFGGSLQPALQDMTAAASDILLNISGLDADRSGVIITTAAGPFEVAQSCAGLNFLLAATMVSSLFAAAAFHDWRRRAGFIALALLLAIAANIARVAV
ncbi:MAG: exosortase/archaeosortase family protein, partial [Amphiplicatus sp.]